MRFDSAGCAPDWRKLLRVPALGVIVTCEPSGPGVDFVSRFFAPAGGVDEDAVTGSAHCVLGPFWGARLHKAELVGYQPGRSPGWPLLILQRHLADPVRDH